MNKRTLLVKRWGNTWSCVNKWSYSVIIINILFIIVKNYNDRELNDWVSTLYCHGTARKLDNTCVVEFRLQQPPAVTALSRGSSLIRYYSGPQDLRFRGRRMQYIISFGRADARDAALLEAAFVLLQEVATQLRAQVFVARVHIHVQAVQLHEHLPILLLEHTSSPQTCGRLVKL